MTTQTLTPTLLDEDVLVIGAGPAGIATAYALEKAGITYRVVDRAHKIASTWDSLYPSLTLNTSRWFSHMPEAPFPREFGIYPTAKQYYRYISEFVEQHQFKIQLGVEVRRVTPSGDLWQVETDQGVWLVPVVISATGIFNSPIMPHIEGMADFKGSLIHAHDYRDPALVENKRVLVVGNGPSGVDISVAAAEVAHSTHIAIRSGVMLRRRNPLGVTMHAWLMLMERLPKAWCRWLMKRISSIDFGDVSRYGLNPPPPGAASVTAYRGPELLDAVKAGKVQPTAAPVRFYENEVEMANGERLPFDVVIMATGYEPVLHQYLDIDMQYNDEPYQAPSPCDWEIGPNGQRGFPLRDTSTHPNGRQILGHPGLYLVGTFYKGKGAMFNFNVEAKIAAEQIREYLAQKQPQRVGEI